MAACLVVVVAVSACADDDTERRFANDPLPPEDLPTSTADATEAVAPPEVAATPAPVSPQALLVPSSGPNRVFFRSGAALWTIGADGTGARPVLSPGVGEVRDFAASPGGDQAAVLLVEDVEGTERTTLVVLDADGTETRRHENLEASLTAGDATADGARPSARSVTWSPVDEQLLVTFENGGLLAVPVSGSPVLLVGAAQASHAGDATWSPAGDAIAYLQPVGTGEPAGLYVARAGPAPLDPVPIVAPEAGGGRTISGVAWLADGSGILFSEGSTSGAGTGGDLFAVSPAGQDRRLVASAGRAAPVAQVVDFAPSPDGRAVAFTVFAPAAEGPTFHSLWLQQMGGGSTTPIAVAAGETVTDLWWTSAGLVWQAEVNAAPGATDYQGGPFALYRADGQGDPVELFRADPTGPATPAATPDASPVGG